MKKKMKIQKGIIGTPSGSNSIVSINSKGVITSRFSAKDNVKRPSKKK